jgi:putative membrane protein insertion efficiency factor
MGRIIVKMIRGYQKVFSPDSGFLVRIGLKRPGNICVFYPSCSEYMILATEKYGGLRGVSMGVKRILRCHPWQKEHIDFP